MKKLLYYWFPLLISVLALPACDNYLDRQPLSGPSDETYFANQEELVLAVNGIYAADNYTVLDNMPLNVCVDNGTDIGWDRNNSPLQSLGKGNHDSNNGFALSVWTNAYIVIGRCNNVLDNAPKVKEKTTPAIYNRSIAEARFMRARTYQYLIDYFGGVPLVTQSLNLTNSQLGRNSKEEVLDFILAELDAAAADLPLSYSGNDVGRATKGAALAIKARAALYGEKWDIAAEAARSVMALNVYALHNDFRALFSYAGENSREIIFALQFLKASRTRTHSMPGNLLSRNAQGFSNKVPSQSLVDSYQCTDGLDIDQSPLYDPARPFQNRDPRLGYTIAVPGSVYFNYQFETHRDSVKCWNYNTTPATRVDNQDALNAFATFTGYCWRKYIDLQDKEDRSNSELNITQIRYAEVLLIYAEAMIEANKIDQSVYEAINQIRQRPGVNMPAISSGKTQAEMRSIVRKERLHELAMEGFRLSDIRRWKIAEQVMNGPFYGRVQRGLLTSAPAIDENGSPDYSAVPNKDQLRVIEVRKFNAARDYLWPIPNVETVTIPGLVQNPNY
ncbi:RagB/SusD family nutrient uptake outer membrane protein [Arcticibacter sp. MXS-1]|uniref:RagB/SusD family nutrient uptake outer membrane protein n=1 Tax=Arcticibacter sp. MXS-1 TaxID=3341726 RepID=UPI0035A90514